MTKRQVFLTAMLAGLTLAAGGGGHRLPTRPPPRQEVPDAGFELHMLDDLQALAVHVIKRTVRVEATHRLQPPFDRRFPRMEDGAGVIVAEGSLLTTARYLEGAESIRIVRRDGRFAPARLTRLDPEAGLAILEFQAKDLPGTAVLRGFAGIPPPQRPGAASEVVVPLNLVGTEVSVRLAAILDDPEATFLSGELSNGIPAFDSHGRLVALADRPTPDRSRSVAFKATDIAAWLDR